MNNSINSFVAIFSVVSLIAVIYLSRKFGKKGLIIVIEAWIAVGIFQAFFDIFIFLGFTLLSVLGLTALSNRLLFIPFVSTIIATIITYYIMRLIHGHVDAVSIAELTKDASCKDFQITLEKDNKHST